MVIERPSGQAAIRHRGIQFFERWPPRVVERLDSGAMRQHPRLALEPPASFILAAE
jgi:hypothetical protein